MNKQTEMYRVAKEEVAKEAGCQVDMIRCLVDVFDKDSDNQFYHFITEVAPARAYGVFISGDDVHLYEWKRGWNEKVFQHGS